MPRSSVGAAGKGDCSEGASFKGTHLSLFDVFANMILCVGIHKCLMPHAAYFSKPHRVSLPWAVTKEKTIHAGESLFEWKADGSPAFHR